MSKTAAVTWVDGMEFRAETGSGHTVTLDAREEAGGGNRGPRPAEMVLVGLGGCTGMDIVSILRKMRQEFSRVEVEISGEEREEHPRSFETIHVGYRVWGSNLASEKVERAIRLSRDRYCVVAHLASGRAALHYRYQINDGPWFDVSPELAD